MNTKLILTICIFLSCVSCKSTDSADIKGQIFIDRIAKEGTISDVILDTELIPLQYKNSEAPKAKKNVIVKEGHIFICDQENVIHVFSMDGKKISDSRKKIGHGHGEYYIMTGWTYNKYSKTIELLTTDKMMIYDLNFNFVKSADLPIYKKHGGRGLFFGHIDDLSATIHLLIPNHLPEFENSAEVIVFNSENNTILNKFSYGEDIVTFLSMQNDCFSEFGKDSLFFYPPAMSKYFYAMDRQTMNISKMIKIDWGGNSIQPEQIEGFRGNNKRLMSYLMTCDKTIVIRVMQSEGFVIAYQKKGNKVKDSSILALNLNQNKAYEIKVSLNDESMLPTFSCLENGYAYIFARTEDLNAEVINALNATQSYNSFKDSLDNDQVVILKCHIKDKW